MEKNYDTQMANDFDQVHHVDETKSSGEHVDSQDISKAEIEPVNQNLAPDTPGNAGHSGKLMKVDREVLFIPKDHPRQDKGDIQSLKNSIRQNGIFAPFIVYPAEDGKYGIIDGSRRLLIAEELGIDEIHCHVTEPLKAQDASIQSYAINAERSGFNPIEEAIFLSKLGDEYGFTRQEMALKVNKTTASISNSLKLLNLDESVQQFIREGKLTAAHGLAIAKLPTAKEQARKAKQCVDHDITAKNTQFQVNQYLAKQAGKKAPKLRHQVPDGDVPGVYLKDSRDMSELPNASVHFVMGSPNYNIGKEFEIGISHDVHLAESAETCKEIGRVLAPGGIIAINIADIHNFPVKGNDHHTRSEPMAHKWVQMLRRHRINLTDIIIWQKNTIWTPPRHFKVFNEDTVHTSYRFLHNYEYVLIFRKEGERELPPEDVVQQSRISKEQFVSWAPAVWHIPSVWKNEGHPTQYPDELCFRLIKMFSYEGDTVLDPWLGSGTTMKVARELNRNGVGYERDLRYKEVIMQKLGLVPEVAVAEEAEASMSEFAKTQFDDTVNEAVEPDDQSSLDQPQPKAEYYTNDPSWLAKHNDATAEVSE